MVVSNEILTGLPLAIADLTTTIDPANVYHSESSTSYNIGLP